MTSSIVYYYGPSEDLTQPPFPMPKVGDRFMIGDYEVVVTAVIPATKVDGAHFTIQGSAEVLDGDESYPEEADNPFWQPTPKENDDPDQHA